MREDVDERQSVLRFLEAVQLIETGADEARTPHNLQYTHDQAS
jgi:hypothetical protein